jgi:hypothetical protein
MFWRKSIEHRWGRSFNLTAERRVLKTNLGSNAATKELIAKTILNATVRITKIIHVPFSGDWVK